MDRTKDEMLASLDTTGVSYSMLAVAHAGIKSLHLINVGAPHATFSDVNFSGSSFTDCHLGGVMINKCNINGMAINGKSVAHALAATFGNLDKEDITENVATDVMKRLNISKTSYVDCTSLKEATEAVCGDWHDAVMGQMDNLSAGKLGELAACWQPANKWTREAHAMMRPDSGRSMAGVASYDFSGKDTLVELATMVVLEAMLRIMLAEFKQ